jgi:hypothetical protein
MGSKNLISLLKVFYRFNEDPLYKSQIIKLIDKNIIKYFMTYKEGRTSTEELSKQL